MIDLIMFSIHSSQRKMTPKRKRKQLESQENVKRTKKDKGQENVVFDDVDFVV